MPPRTGPLANLPVGSRLTVEERHYPDAGEAEWRPVAIVSTVATPKGSGRRGGIWTTSPFDLSRILAHWVSDGDNDSGGRMGTRVRPTLPGDARTIRLAPLVAACALAIGLEKRAGAAVVRAEQERVAAESAYRAVVFAADAAREALARAEADRSDEEVGSG